MIAATSPLLPLSQSLAAIARSGDARALRDHLQGRGLPLIGGDAEPAELILRALGEMRDVPQLGAELAPLLATVIAESTANLKIEGLTPVLRLQLEQALRLAADLPADATLDYALRALANSLEESAPDFWFQEPLASVMARALCYQQTGSETENLWLQLLDAAEKGPWTAEWRTVLLSAWRGLLHVPPDAKALQAGRVVNIDRIERGLLTLEAGIRSREGGSRLVRLALQVLTETFPRSPQFWEERLSNRLGQWPAELREAVVGQWPGVERLNGTTRLEAAKRSERPFGAPRSPIEHALAELWRELLGVDRVGIYDNFLELGGDSLQLIELASHIRTDFGVELPAHRLMTDIVNQASVISEALAEQSDPLEALLSELESLSEIEAQQFLEAEDKERR